MPLVQRIFPVLLLVENKKKKHPVWESNPDSEMQAIVLNSRFLSPRYRKVAN